MIKQRISEFFSNTRLHICMTWCVIGAMVIFYALTIRAGHNWNGDFAHFVHHAKNIVEENSYIDLNYIINPYNWLSPISYPPVVPLLLVPIYFLFGLNLTAMKLMMIACFAASLVVINKLFKNELHTYSLLVLTVCLAFNPYFWDFKDRILSEYPYILFSIISLLLMQRCYVENKPTRNLLIPVLLGTAMYLAYGSREIGIVLPLTVLTFEVINFRKLTRSFIISIAVFSLFAFIQHHALQNDYFSSSLQQQIAQMNDEAKGFRHNHIDLMNTSLGHIATQAHHYYVAVQTLFFFPKTTLFSSLLFYSTCLLSVIGFISIIRKRITVIDIYPLGYIAVLLLFAGYPRMRYLMPIIPFFLFYAFIGMQSLRLFGIKHLENIVITFILIATITSYVQNLSTMNYIRIERGVKTQYATEMFDYISAATKPNDVIIFREPRILGLFTDRDASIYPKREDPDFLIRYMNVIGAEYVVSRIHTDDQLYLLPLINQRQQHFTTVLENEEFIVYRYE